MKRYFCLPAETTREARMFRQKLPSKSTFLADAETEESSAGPDESCCTRIRPRQIAFNEQTPNQEKVQKSGT